MTGPADRPRIVIIGAGATGRGHIGQLASGAGFAVTFIEKKPDLIERLEAAGRYVVGLAGETVREIVVSGFRILHKDDFDACAEAIAGADIAATAVLPTNLESTTRNLADGLALRKRLAVEKPLNVIACENMERSSSTLREYLRRSAPALDWEWIDSHVGFPDSMVARAVPVPKDPLYLLAEADQEWTVDETAVRRPIPRLPGLTLSPNQEAALERKFYIKNTGHYAIGLAGAARGFKLMDEAARDEEVFALVDAATRESAAAVAAKHGFSEDETERYRAGFLRQMKSPFLPDEISRVIREPIRKLGREERLVGPAMLACAQGRAPEALARVIALAFLSANAGDSQAEELRAEIRAHGLTSTLERFCEIPRDHALAALVREAYAAMGGGAP